MFRLTSPSPLHAFSKAESLRPSARKHIPDLPYTVYQSRPLAWENHFGVPILSDFGLARYGEQTFSADARVQPLQYQAPEVILKLGWDCKIDIWNLGCVVYNLLSGELLFRGVDDALGCWMAARHLREVIEVLGMPPRDLFAGKVMGRAVGFDERGALYPPPFLSFL